MAAIAPALASATQICGDASPSGAVIVVTITGSGFHDGPPTVFKSSCAISRPQMTHAKGSYVGADGSSTLSNPSARLPAIIATGSDTKRPVARAMPARGRRSMVARPLPPPTRNVNPPATRNSVPVEDTPESRPEPERNACCLRPLRRPTMFNKIPRRR
jgi:hypothetical protein